MPTDEAWLYLALVLDLYARKLVSWAMSETMPQELTLQALEVALGSRDPDAGLVHHSDRGSLLGCKKSSQHQFVEPQIVVRIRCSRQPCCTGPSILRSPLRGALFAPSPSRPRELGHRHWRN